MIRITYSKDIPPITYLSSMFELFYLIPIFFVIAFVYSSVGLGGGSSYLAVLSLMSLPFVDLRMIALICNIVVVSSSVVLFDKHNYLRWRKIIPLILLSLPLAYLGGRLKLDARFFYLLLGGSLIIGAILMLLDIRRKSYKLPKYSNAVIGGGIGFLSGVVGIGGGVFLSPILHLTNWAKPKTIAATTAAFILVNSTAGLLGQVHTNGFQLDWPYVIGLVVAVILGSQLGVRLTIHKLNPKGVRRVTAVVILLVAIRLLLKNL